MTKKLRISVLLMLLTIVVITGFQSFWLMRSYREEKAFLETRTGLLFRETVLTLQASKLKLDTTMNVRLKDKTGVIKLTNVIRDRVRDTTIYGGRMNSTVIISSRTTSPGMRDTLQRVFTRRPNENVMSFLVGIDSLQAPVTVPEITKAYAAALKKEGLGLPFKISATAGSRDPDSLFIPPDPTSHRMTIGFSKPMTFDLDLENEAWHVLKGMWQTILVSVLLVGVTILSFLVLYRNLIRQRRLTQLKNDFISNITHELKTPIATVSVAIEALKSFNAMDDPARTREYLDISGQELQRLSLLVDKVLKLSMFEKQQIEVRMENFDLFQLTEEVVSSMRLQAEKYHAKIAIETTGRNFTLNGDRMHITSVLFNLLDNALKYSKANPSIQVSLKEDDSTIELAVTDNGTGIPAAYKHRVFEKFFRVPNGDRHNVKGYGLGLSYVSYVVDRHKGQIEVESQEGIGSRFTIKFPRQ